MKLNLETSSAPFKCTNKKMEKLMGINTSTMDKDSLARKKDLLNMLFNKNYSDLDNSPTKQREQKDEEFYSPSFKNLVNEDSSNPWNRAQPSNGTYDTSKNAISLRKMGSSKDNYDFGDYSNSAVPKLAMSMSRSKSNSVHPRVRDTSLLKVIKNRRYNPKEDRTIAIRDRISMKRSILNDEIHQKAKQLKVRNKIDHEKMGQAIKYTGCGKNLMVRVAHTDKDQGNLEKMNSGILKR